MATFQDVQTEVNETLREISEAIARIQELVQNGGSPTSAEFQEIVDKLAAARAALDAASQPTG